MSSLTTRRIIPDVLNDGLPHTSREIASMGEGCISRLVQVLGLWADPSTLERGFR